MHCHLLGPGTAMPWSLAPPVCWSTLSNCFFMRSILSSQRWKQATQPPSPKQTNTPISITMVWPMPNNHATFPYCSQYCNNVAFNIAQCHTPSPPKPSFNSALVLTSRSLRLIFGPMLVKQRIICSNSISDNVHVVPQPKNGDRGHAMTGAGSVPFRRHAQKNEEANEWEWQGHHS